MRVQDINETSGAVIGACVEVHRHLGPGLLEGIYHDCLGEELRLRNIAYERQVVIPVRYKGLDLGSRYRIDLVVKGIIVVELKSVECILPVHKAQILSQLRMTGLKVGLLINFNVPRLVEGVKRVVNDPDLDLSLHMPTLVSP
jgi:GxxExxY protein